MNNEIKNKEEILKELLLTEEDTLTKLRVLIDKTKTLVKIDQKTNKIVISSEYLFSNPEKILLLLIGRYFSKELGISNTEGTDIQELEKESGIKKTTLSKPLGGLSNSGYIGQDNGKRYFVHHYKIEEIVNLLHSKFIEKTPDAKGIQIKYKPSPTRKKKGEKNE
jgi:hypothetical protein